MRLRRFGREDEGSALIAVVGIMIVLTVLAIGAFTMADDNLFQAKRDRRSAQALGVAEAGLEQALWRLNDGTVPLESGVPFSVDTSLGACTIEPTQDGLKWHIVAVGSVGTTPTVQRTISVDVLAISMWDMFYSNTDVNPGMNGHINGSGTFHGSMYMRGNWPPSNGNAAFEVGPFFVKDGDINLGGSATIGMGGKVDLYCNGVVNPVGINANLHTNVPDLPMPKQGQQDLTQRRNWALNESTDGFQGTPNTAGGSMTNDEQRTSGISTGAPSPRSGYYKVVDNDSTVNTSVASFYIGKAADGTVIPSFGKPYDPVLGHSSDDFSWDATRGVLTVQGTVFVDAQDLYIRDVKWAGKGTIVCTGNVHIDGKWEPSCFTVDPIATDPENELGYPKKHVVGISASGAVYEYSPDGYGPFFSNVSWSMDPAANDHQFHGTIMAPDITLGKHSNVWTTPNMGANIPSGMPGPVGQVVAITGWHEGRN